MITNNQYNNNPLHYSLHDIRNGNTYLMNENTIYST